MTWKQFVQQWRPVELTRLGIPNRTVYGWRDGSKEPQGWQRAAAAFWIEAKAGEKRKLAGDAESAAPKTGRRPSKG